ncbi:ribonuclease HI [Rhizobium skierniewicense]|uniref:ribonuclease H n=1 Tax=Rhizobium skierniewicense TaxID=984260 RepID=A0A7W6CBJ8_9HYPH|nr:RNase H family protein [Rhizobium skierniewicense]MBB3945510.1 ribonuclease HI [Rhizobium skierniewicense]
MGLVSARFSFSTLRNGDLNVTSHETSLKPDTIGFARTQPVDIYVDGSYDVVSKKGGWAFVVFEGDDILVTQSGTVAAGTNNAVEVVATLNAARWASENFPLARVTIWSDSMHVVEGCNHWRPIWRNNGWKHYNPDPRARNRRIADWALWTALDRHLLQNQQLAVAWCKGHQGHIGNELADRLAAAAYSSGSARS